MSTTPNVALELVTRLVAAYPSARAGDDTKALWAEQLRQVSEPTARAAVSSLLRERRSWPAVSDFWRAVNDHRERTAERQPSSRALPAPVCDECGGDGWMFTTPVMNPSVGDVAPCSRGCKPPRPSAHVAARDVESDPAVKEFALAQIARARRVLNGDPE